VRRRGLIISYIGDGKNIFYEINNILSRVLAAIDGVGIGN
jgi:hypothetical protein